MENEVEEYLHVLEGREQELLHLCQGENWLRLFISAKGFDLLADTDSQDDNQDNNDETESPSIKTTIPNASIISLEEVGTVEWPTDDCFICIDVDAGSVAVKDMRNIANANDKDLDTGFVVCLQKRFNAINDDARSSNTSVETDNENDDDYENDTYNKLEELPRRQLRLIHSGDRLCTLTTKQRTSDELSQQECTGHLGLVLTYRRYCGTAKHRYSNTQVSQLTGTSLIDAVPPRLMIAMNTQDSQLIMTEKLDSQIPRSLDTALVPPRQVNKQGDEDDHDSLELDDDDGEQTQIIPLATQEDDAGEVADEISPRKLVDSPNADTKKSNGGPKVVDDKPGNSTSQLKKIEGGDDAKLVNGLDFAHQNSTRHDEGKLQQCDVYKIICHEADIDVMQAPTVHQAQGDRSQPFINSANVALPPCDKDGDTTDVDVHDSAASTLPSGRSQNSAHPLPTDSKIHHVLSTIQDNGQPQSDRRNNQMSVTVDDTLSRDRDDSVDDDKSEVTCLSEIDDNIHGIQKDQERLGSFMSGHGEMAHHSLESGLVRLFNPRAHGTGARTSSDTRKNVFPRTEDSRGQHLATVNNPPDDVVFSNADNLSDRTLHTLKDTKSNNEPSILSKNVSDYPALALDSNSNKMDLGVEPERSATSLLIESPRSNVFSRKRKIDSRPPDSEPGRKTRTSVIQPRPSLDLEDSQPALSSIGSRKRQRKESKNVNVLVTGVQLSTGHRSKIMAIGGKILDSTADAMEATHVIVSDGTESIRRTPKLMIALCKTSNIVSMKWLDDSARKRKPLSTTRYLVLNDVEAEKKYNFNMQQSLQNGERLRQHDETILNGLHVFVCKGVAGNKAPPEDELKLIVQAAGGKWIRAATGLKQFRADNAMIITSDPPLKKELSSNEVTKAIKDGIQHNTTSWLFNCLLRQEVIEK